MPSWPRIVAGARRDSLSSASCVPPALPAPLEDRERDELVLAQARAEGHGVQHMVSETRSMLAGDLEQGSLLALGHVRGVRVESA